MKTALDRDTDFFFFFSTICCQLQFITRSLHAANNCIWSLIATIDRLSFVKPRSKSCSYIYYDGVKKWNTGMCLDKTLLKFKFSLVIYSFYWSGWPFNVYYFLCQLGNQQSWSSARLAKSYCRQRYAGVTRFEGVLSHLQAQYQVSTSSFCITQKVTQMS